MFIGFGTVVNVGTVALGSVVGLLLGDRLPARIQMLVTQTMGLVTLVLGGFSVVSVFGRGLSTLIGTSAPIVVLVLGLVLGALIGSGWQLEQRLAFATESVKSRLGRSGDTRFAEGLITATLLFCVGPLTILGSINDGLGRGAEQLLVKAVMDGFVSVAFAASLGVGVLFSAVAVGVIQGTLTLLGWVAGDFFAGAYVDAISAAGGVLLLALGLRILGCVKIAVADLLPALFTTPLLVWVIAAATS